jgi:hypothetical protein
MEADFPYELVKEDLSINATSLTNSTYIRYMNVISVNDTAKTFTAMFGGAYSGQFQINVRHRRYGLVGTNGLILDVSSSITDFSPMTGSIYGGTLLTIRGTNFGNVKTDNPVQISNNGGIGSIDCFVQETKVDEIKCRVDTNLNKTGGIEDSMIVFLKTSEEAKCEPLSKCKYTWNFFIPDIHEFSVFFDESTYEWMLKATGETFSGDTTTTEMLIGGLKQTTTSVSNTQALFKIDNVTSQSLKNNVLYFDAGIPKNHSLVEATKEIQPKLVSITPTSGSIGGSLITARIPGATVSNKVDIVDGNGDTICQSIKVVSYGVVECKTLAKEMAASELSIKQDMSTFACVNSDKALCTYQQTATTFPAVASTSKTDSTIVFTGTNLELAEFTVSAVFANVSADSVLINSAT